MKFVWNKFPAFFSAISENTIDKTILYDIQYYQQNNINKKIILHKE